MHLQALRRKQVKQAVNVNPCSEKIFCGPRHPTVQHLYFLNIRLKRIILQMLCLIDD